MENGSGNRARIAGYRWPEKPERHKNRAKEVMGRRRIASFIGFAPVENPKVAGIIILDEPQGPVKYGGVIAAPFFSTIVGDTLKYLEVNPVNVDGRQRKTRKKTPWSSRTCYICPKAEAIQILRQIGLTHRELGDGRVCDCAESESGGDGKPKNHHLTLLDEESRYRKNIPRF